MSGPETTQESPAYKWEQSLIDDYRNYRWHQVIEPLCDKLQLWKTGEMPHSELDEFMEEIHQQLWEIRNIFNQRRDRLVNLVQWWDREWFLEWVGKYSPPPGVTVLQEPSEPTADRPG